MTGTMAMTKTTRSRGLAAICTYSGAVFPSKKTLIFAQNLENKGVEFFLPRRSMVLKVVRGKILETLELAWPPACSSIASAPRGLTGPSIWKEREGETVDGLSEIIVRGSIFVVRDSIIFKTMLVVVCYQK